jgi:outer membrane protein TolC
MKTRTLLPVLVALMAALALPAAAEELSITGMLTTAEAANPALQSAALTLENARVAYDRSIASSDARLDQIKAELQWERSQLNFGQATVRELLSLAEAYVRLQQANENLSMLEERLRLAQLDQQQAAERVEIGAASPVTELQARVAALNAELNLAGARNTRQFTTLPDLADATGIDMAALDAATLASQPPAVSGLGSLDSYLATTAARVEHDFAARQLEIDELDLKLKSMQSTSPLDLQTATNTVASSRATVESTASDLQLATAGAYASAQQALGTVTLRELQLELQAENTRRTQEQFDAGLLTESQLASSQADLVGAEDALRAAQWSAYFAWIRLHDAAGTDVLAEWEGR